MAKEGHVFQLGGGGTIFLRKTRGHQKEMRKNGNKMQGEALHHCLNLTLELFIQYFSVVSGGEGRLGVYYLPMKRVSGSQWFIYSLNKYLSNVQCGLPNFTPHFQGLSCWLWPPTSYRGNASGKKYSLWSVNGKNGTSSQGLLCGTGFSHVCSFLACDMEVRVVSGDPCSLSQDHIRRDSPTRENCCVWKGAWHGPPETLNTTQSSKLSPASTAIKDDFLLPRFTFPFLIVRFFKNIHFLW